MNALLGALFLLAVSTPPPTPPELAGDQAWSRRAEGFASTGEVSPGPILEAIDAYRRALQSSPESLGLRSKLLRALYFRGHFAGSDLDGASRRDLYDEMVELAERGLEIVGSRAPETEEESEPAPGPERDEAYRRVDGAGETLLWACVSWGLRAAENPIRHAMDGTPRRIRDYAISLSEVDERLGHGAGYRILGRIHTLAPRFPFVTGWIDRDLGISVLRRALEVSDQDSRNQVFLAEALLRHRAGDCAARAEARDLLETALSRPPDPAELVEQQETLDLARRLRQEWPTRRCR